MTGVVVSKLVSTDDLDVFAKETRKFIDNVIGRHNGGYQIMCAALNMCINV